MQVELLNALQCLQVGLAYAFALFLFPRLLFTKHLRGKSLSYQFWFSVIVGNFYLVQVVFLLALPGFNNAVTMPLAAFGGAFGVYCWNHRPEVLHFLKSQWGRFKRLIFGSYGIRLYLKDSLRLQFRLQKLRGRVSRVVLHHWAEWLLLLLCSGYAFWYFSYQTFHYYGFGAPDLSVHENWINNIAEQNLFSSGVYPFGFHCVIYFLYEVFHVEIYASLRFFGPIQFLLILYGLFSLLRRLCKNRYTPFIGILIYIMFPWFNFQVHMRFSWALPQEFGMAMIYPAVLFLWKYLDSGKKTDLMLFGAAFSLTLSGHFYDTIIAFLFCLAVGLSYLRRIIRRKMLLPILLAGIVSVAVSLAPLGISLLAGNRLEPSLNWALGVMQSSGEQEITDTGEESSLPEDGTESLSPDEDGLQEGTKPSQQPAPSPGILDKLKTKLSAVYALIQTNLLIESNSRAAYFLCLALVFLYCLVQLFRRNKNGRLNSWLSVALYNVLLFALLGAHPLGLPNLMDSFRTSIYLCYALVPVYVMAADMLLQLLANRRLLYRTAGGVVAGAVLCTGVAVPAFGWQRPLSATYLLQFNGAFLAMESIKHDFPKQKWTIVSGADEVRPVWGYGWHYETIDFLAKQDDEVLNIPTQYVFFFVEKQPLVYGQTLFMNDPKILKGEISEELADTPLVLESQASGYYQGQRSIVMSKLNRYLEEFQKLYPNELRVYYEDDDFICYMLEQNEYNLYNFAMGGNPFQ